MKLRTKQEERWITVTIDGDTAEVLIRPMNPKQMQALLAQATEAVWERNQRFEQTNFFQYRLLKIEAVIRDWKDLLDETGAPIPCTKETREIVYLNNPAFIERVLDEADRIAERLKEDKAGAEKN